MPEPTIREIERTERQALSGQALERDRRRTAKSIVFDVNEWKHRVNVVDYRDYDVRRTNIPEKKRSSLEDLVEDDKEGFRTRVVKAFVDKIKNQHLKPNIKDFQSFKDAFKNAFGSEEHSKNFYGILSGQEDLLMRMFAEPDIQQEVTKNGQESVARGLMRKYPQIKNIQQARMLYRQIRRHEIQLISKGWIPETQLKMPRIARSPTQAPQRMMIAQSVREGGSLYRRSKPMPYSEPQMRFLRNNADVPTSKITAEFNVLFNDSRTRSSIYYKRYRLLKG